MNDLNIGDMKEICINLGGCTALGDTLCATPLIRKISKTYNKKVSVISYHPDLFKRSPYIDNNFPYSVELLDQLKEDYEIMSTFDLSYRPDGVCYKHNVMDIRQFHAISLGFMLTKDEMELDFFPDNITVISVGKDSHETGGSMVQKPVFNFDIKLGYNLMNQSTLEQTWYLISKSSCFITMDSGLLHLAGTTDCEILQLGSSINPEFRSPYRHGSQEYKYHYVRGGCGLNCASDMKHGVKEWGSIQGVPSLVGCLEHKEKFECHPSVIQVYLKVLEILGL